MAHTNNLTRLDATEKGKYMTIRWGQTPLIWSDTSGISVYRPIASVDTRQIMQNEEDQHISHT